MAGHRPNLRKVPAYSDSEKLVEILASMVDSALAWEQRLECLPRDWIDAESPECKLPKKDLSADAKTQAAAEKGDIYGPEPGTPPANLRRPEGFKS